MTADRDRYAHNRDRSPPRIGAPGRFKGLSSRGPLSTQPKAAKPPTTMARAPPVPYGRDGLRHDRELSLRVGRRGGMRVSAVRRTRIYTTDGRWTQSEGVIR